MANYESSDCLLCGHNATSATRFHQDALRVVRCQACQLWYLSPRLTESSMRAHYERADYFEGGRSGYESYAAQESPLRMTFGRLLSRLSRKNVCGGSVLDVGCGYGYFLQEASSHFEQRYGTDYSQEALTRAQRHADQVFRGGADAVPDHLRFDCVVALHVVEHVYDPLTFIKSLYHRLKPGGTLLLAAPDMGSWWRQLMGSRWPSFKYPEHVAFYDRKTLTQLMSTVDLIDHQSVPYPHAFPMDLVLQKLGLPGIPSFGRKAIWVPRTTVAIAATKPVSIESRLAA